MSLIGDLCRPDEADAAPQRNEGLQPSATITRLRSHSSAGSFGEFQVTRQRSLGDPTGDPTFPQPPLGLQAARQSIPKSMSHVASDLLERVEAGVHDSSSSLAHLPLANSAGRLGDRELDAESTSVVGSDVDLRQSQPWGDATELDWAFQTPGDCDWSSGEVHGGVEMKQPSSRAVDGEGGVGAGELRHQTAPSSAVEAQLAMLGSTAYRERARTPYAMAGVAPRKH